MCFTKEKSKGGINVIKHFCDKCGKEIEQAKGADVVVTKQNNYCGLIFSSEVCEECAKKLKEWLSKE